MPRFTAQWLEIAREQYQALPEATQRDIDARVVALLEQPEGPPGAYHHRRDQWTTTYGGGRGLIVYAVATNQHRVLILRLVPLDPYG